MNPFTYGLNASTIRGTPVLDQIRIAADAGYRAIELWYADTDAHRAGGGSLDEIAHAASDAGLAVPTLIYFAGWFDCPEPGWAAVRETAARRFSEAAEMGARHVICSPPGGHADSRTGARRYSELLALGRSLGVEGTNEFVAMKEIELGLGRRRIEGFADVAQMPGAGFESAGAGAFDLPGGVFFHEPQKSLEHAHALDAALAVHRTGPGAGGGADQGGALEHPFGAAFDDAPFQGMDVGGIGGEAAGFVPGMERDRFHPLVENPDQPQIGPEPSAAV